MARRIHHITSLMDGYLIDRFGALKTGAETGASVLRGETGVFSANQEAFLLGEAVFRVLFFKTLDQLHIVDGESRVFLWQKLVEDRKHIVLICERSLLNKYGRQLLPHIEEQEYDTRCYILWCSFLRDMQISEAA